MIHTNASVSLPLELMNFVTKYQKDHQLRSRSVVLAEAVSLLRERELAKSYAEANNEIDHDFDVTSADGLNDETWYYFFS